MIKKSPFTLEEYAYDDVQLQKRLDKLQDFELSYEEQQADWRLILQCIDLTTLSGADNRQTVTDLCRKALNFKDAMRNISAPGAVCVYPPFVSICKEMLRDSGIRVASVAGAFPAGQTPIEIKAAEVQYALQQGADEIDMVISRGKFLEGNYQEVYDEICAIRQICKHVVLKVILETGELVSAQNIYKASQIAMAAGADFIKTSTGKIPLNATPKSFLVMTDAIKRHYETTGIKVGIKPAGGISEPETAWLFVRLLAQTLGKEWLSPKYFRIGASRLAEMVFRKIK